MAKQVISARLEPHHKEVVISAAASKGMTLTEYVTAILVKAAKTELAGSK